MFRTNITPYRWRGVRLDTPPMESGNTMTVANGGPGTPCPADDAGTPTCPTGYGASAEDGAGFDELNVSGHTNIGHFNKTPFRQFNTSAFSVPAMRVRGDSGLGTVRGPGQNNLDLSLAKTFPIREEPPLRVSSRRVQRPQPYSMDRYEYCLSEFEPRVPVWNGEFCSRSTYRTDCRKVRLLTAVYRSATGATCISRNRMPLPLRS